MESRWRNIAGTLQPRTRWRRLLERVDDAYSRRLASSNHVVGQRILVAGVYREGSEMPNVVQRLKEGSQVLDFALGSMGGLDPALRAETTLSNLRGGKFQNLNELLESAGQDHDWVVLVDDDIGLPPRFLDTMLTACSLFDFALAQPAQTRQSYANWSTTRRHTLRAARETRFVEIGPVTFIRRDAAAVLLPFPADHRWGWGLDFRWSYLMHEVGLRIGVVDAAAVVHDSQAVASTYSWQAAQQEGQEFLSRVPHAPTKVAHQTVKSFWRMRAV